MKNKKGIILWSIWIVLICTLLYYNRDVSLRLLWVDIKTGFQYASLEEKRVIWILRGLLLLGMAILVCWKIFKENLLIISWNIRIRQKNYVINSGEISFRRFFIMVISAFLMFFISMFLKDILAERGGEPFKITLIAHALGGIDDKSYTNSKEALVYNYELGHRAFEVDLSVTSDKKLVCVHDWEHGAFIQNRGEKIILTKDEFEKGIIFEKYTPVSVEELLTFMEKHKDVWIVTDTKDSDADLVTFEISYIVNTAESLGIENVLDRIAVQIYNPEMYEVVCEIYEFPGIIFTMYQYWGGDPEKFVDICRYCAYMDIDIIAMWYYLATPEVIERADQFGIEIYVHTLDDVDMVVELQELGVKGFYTDFLTPDIFKNAVDSNN